VIPRCGSLSFFCPPFFSLGHLPLSLSPPLVILRQTSGLQLKFPHLSPFIPPESPHQPSDFPSLGFLPSPPPLPFFPPFNQDVLFTCPLMIYLLLPLLIFSLLFPRVDCPFFGRIESPSPSKIPFFPPSPPPPRSPLFPLPDGLGPSLSSFFLDPMRIVFALFFFFPSLLPLLHSGLFSVTSALFDPSPSFFSPPFFPQPFLALFSLARQNEAFLLPPRSSGQEDPS